MNKSEHLLSCLSEECNEVAHRVSKALRFGLNEIQPGQPLTNSERIIEEAQDMIAVLKMLQIIGVLPLIDMLSPERLKQKIEKLLKYMDYAKQCGVLTESK